MWRALVAIIGAVACATPDPNVNPDTNVDAPRPCAMLPFAPPSCEPGGLADIDLAGAWTLTGTRSDNHCLAAPPTEEQISQPLNLQVDGCSFTDGNNTGMLDDTFATASNNAGPGAISTRTSVCVNATTGMLDYTHTQTMRCIPTNPTPDTITTSGTLTR